MTFLPLDLTNPNSVENVLSHIDLTMQYGEDEEPKEVGAPRWSFPLFLRPCPASRGKDRRGLHFILSWNIVKLTVSPFLFTFALNSHDHSRLRHLRALRDCRSCQLDAHYNAAVTSYRSIFRVLTTPN